LSSHLLAEIEQSVDDVVIVQRDLRFAGSLAELTSGGTRRLEDCFFDLVGARDPFAGVQADAVAAAGLAGGGHA